MSKNNTARREAFWYATMRGCTIAIALLLFFFLVTSLFANFTPGIDFKTLVTLLAFSLVISYSGYIFGIQSIPPVARRIFHFFLLAFAFFLVLLATTRTFLVGYILFGIIYVLFTVVTHLLRKRKDRKQAPPKVQAQYTSRFS